ncbi:Rieske (2Fe-2S) protein [Salinibius halmophilus]|uniref:Rieske (2Fe-2S) protein n=1 Tax=Salinibius halmophilus TaxID=1853216 RepID=UPI000E6662F8|nr:Rieske 2Fe-2S domain-containing protein [Salinibius halmophilus]
MKQFIVDHIQEGCAASLTREIFAVRRGGQLYVYQNECPHLGVNLEFQENQFLDSQGAHIICSTHGALFEIATGECIFGPCSGDYLEAIEFDWLNPSTITIR